jgi:hypothetical protein
MALGKSVLKVFNAEIKFCSSVPFESDCKLARVVTIDDEPAALFNIGLTGSSPTVSDKTISKFTQNNVYEFSAVFIADKFLDKKDSISNSIGNMANICKGEAGFTKAFLTIRKDHPYQKDLFLDLVEKS